MRILTLNHKLLSSVDICTIPGDHEEGVGLAEEAVLVAQANGAEGRAELVARVGVRLGTNLQVSSRMFILQNFGQDTRVRWQ